MERRNQKFSIKNLNFIKEHFEKLALGNKRSNVSDTNCELSNIPPDKILNRPFSHQEIAAAITKQKIINEGDIDGPSNYRGISLLSCFGKLFTSCLNRRLTIFIEKRKRLCCCFVDYNKHLIRSIEQLCAQRCYPLGFQEKYLM